MNKQNVNKQNVNKQHVNKQHVNKQHVNNKNNFINNKGGLTRIKLHGIYNIK